MPYEDRISIATPEGVDLEMTLAGLGSRAVARMVDQAIQLAVLLAVGLLAALAGATTGVTGDGGGAVAAAVAVVVVFAVQFGYDVLFEVLASGRTPGKRWSGLRVVRVDGAPVGFVTSAVRNLLRLVDSLPGIYAVAMVAVLASSRNQRLGDMAAATVVVRERRGPRKAGVAPAVAGAAGSHDPTWDVSAVTAEELATIRRFLDRRATLAPHARARLAGDLAARLAPKVVGPPAGLHPERFLEDVAAAKSARL
ncbi:MAG: RDD family protein [Actinomycetota bacterium]